jgi:hypothetical protein
MASAVPGHGIGIMPTLIIAIGSRSGITHPLSDPPVRPPRRGGGLRTPAGAIDAATMPTDAGPRLRPVQTRAPHPHPAPARPNRRYRQLPDLGLRRDHGHHGPAGTGAIPETQVRLALEFVRDSG